MEALLSPFYATPPNLQRVCAKFINSPGIPLVVQNNKGRSSLSPELLRWVKPLCIQNTGRKEELKAKVCTSVMTSYDSDAHLFPSGVNYFATTPVQPDVIQQ